MSVSSVIRQGLGSTTSDLVRLGLGSGAPPPAAIGPIITLGLKYTPSDIIRLGIGASVSTAPVITAVDPVSGTELQVTWTGTASRYRLDGGTPVTLTDTVSPATISGLSPNTLYAVELDNGDGNWSNSVSEWTDNTGGGGGSLAVTLDATGGSGTLSAAASITSNAALAATGGSGTLSAIAAGTAYITMAATGGSGTLSATAYTPATASLAATGGSGTLRAVASGVTSDEDLRGSPPGLNFDADEDEYIEDMQMLMAIAAAAFELEMV